MTTGYVAPVRRTIADRPQPTQSLTTKTLIDLRIATGPGFMAAGVSERMLKQVTHR